MKILYISSSNAKGGGTLALYNIIRGMIERGHEVLVAVTQDAGPLPDMLDAIGCPHVTVRTRLSCYPVHQDWTLPARIAWMRLNNMLARRRLRRIMQQFRPDLVHTNVGPLDVGYDVSHSLGIPHVWHQREYQDLDFDLHFYPDVETFMRKSHAADNYNICITRGVFQHRQFRANRDRVIYDGVFGEQQAQQAEALLQQQPSASEDYVLFVGRIEEAKGARQLLQVFGAFHRRYPHCRLKLVGRYKNDAYYMACRQTVAEAGLADAVDFLGECSDVYALMAGARMLVVPSRFEGFGFITAEAMLCGCPVVGRDTAGTREQFDIGLAYAGAEIGLRFADDAGMLKAMCRVMEEDMTAMCQRARQTVLSHYSLQQHVMQVEDYYRFVLQQMAEQS